MAEIIFGLAVPVAHVDSRGAGNHGVPVVIVQVVLAGNQFIPLVVRAAVLALHADAYRFQVLGVGVGEIVQQAVRVRNIAQLDVLAVEFADAVAVGIFNAGFVQDLLGAFRIVLIGILQGIKAISHGTGNNCCTRAVQAADGVGLADGLVVNGLMNSLTQGLVGQRTAFLHVHPAEAAAGTRRNLNGKLLVCLKGLQVRYVHDVFCQVDLTGPQRIGLGGSITHEQDVDSIKRRLAVPVMGVGNHLVAYMILEALNHIGAGADNTGFRVFGTRIVQNAHGGVSQVGRHIGIGFFRFDGNGAGLIVSRYDCLGIQEFIRSGGTLSAFFTNPVQGFLNLGSGHLYAVAELNALAQLEGPGLVAVAGSGGFRQARNRLYVIVKGEQGLADTKAAYVPGRVGLQGRVDQAVGIHLAAKVQNLGSSFAVFTCFRLFVAAAATCQQTAGYQTCYQ